MIFELSHKGSEMDQSRNKERLVIAPDTKVIDVDTGEYRVSSEAVILQSIALGSCIALVVHERKSGLGGISHIMLPDRSPSTSQSYKYAEDAIDALLDAIEGQGANREELVLAVVGGANVLREGDIPDRVIESVLNYLERLGLELSLMRVGGFERRSVFLDTASGRIYYSEGNSSKKLLLTGIERI